MRLASQDFQQFDRATFSIDAVDPSATLPRFPPYDPEVKLRSERTRKIIKNPYFERSISLINELLDRCTALWVTEY